MRITVAVMVVFLAVFASVLADDRITLTDDLRLHKKVSLSLACEPLSTFAESLSREADVKIRVRPDIADKNITVFAEEIAIHEAMARVAQTLGYGWEVKGEEPDKRSYTLFRSLKKKQEAEDLRQADWKEKDQKFRDVIEDGIKLADADTETWQSEFDKNPSQTRKYYFFKHTLGDLACFTKAQRDDIWDRIEKTPQGETKIPFSELPPSLQKRLREREEERHSRLPEGSPVPDGIESSRLIISRGGGHGSPRISGMPISPRLSFFGLEGYGGSAGLSAVSPDRPISRFALEALKEDGIDVSSYKPPNPDCSDPDSTTERVTIKFDEEGERKSFIRRTFSDILEKASEMLEVNIFADDYLCRYRNSDTRRTTLPEDPQEALAEVGREFDYEVVRIGDDALLKCNTWFSDEPYEAPKRLVVRWADIKKKQKRLELTDYLDIVRRLDNFQITGLGRAVIEGDSPLMWEVMRMGSHIERLRLCSMLNTFQMKQAFEGSITYGTMNPQQRELFRWLLYDASPDLSDDQLMDCAFSMREDSRIDEGDRGDDGGPYRLREDLLVFMYILSKGEKKYEMYMGFERLEPEKPAAK